MESIGVMNFVHERMGVFRPPLGDVVEKIRGSRQATSGPSDFITKYGVSTIR